MKNNVSGAGIQTHDLMNIILIPQPLDLSSPTPINAFQF